MPNYATQYCAALSQAYPNVLHFGALFGRNQEGDYRWANNHTIEVPSLKVSGRIDGSRSQMIDKRQRHQNSWTPLTLRNHRAWNDFIHPRDIVETNYVLSIQNITRAMNEQEKFPEKDKYLISTLYSDWLLAGRTPLTGVLTTENILQYFDLMSINMTEHNVPAAGRILYVTPAVNVILKGATAFYRNLTIQGTAPASVQRAIASLDGVTIEEIPSDCMLTAYDFTVGAVRGVSAKQVNMLLIHPSCVITPEVYDFAQLDEPSAGSQGKYEYFEESFDDVFLLPNNQYGPEFLIAGLNAEEATFASVAGSTTGTTKVTVTAPIGAAAKVDTRYFYAVATSTAPEALKLGEVAKDNEAWTEWDGESEIAAANGSKMTMLVCSDDGRVYASGSNTITART